ncbi:MAG: hypothetical protein SGI86_20030 [Deltaproteobacteria bacterium]|nr:hypothetical protein [Deltaproteobacteria bacterium]
MNTRIIVAMLLGFAAARVPASLAAGPRFAIESKEKPSFAPLDALTVLATHTVGATVTVSDGVGRTYFRGPSAARVTLTVAGALGKHTVSVLDAQGKVVDRTDFPVDAKTAIDDGAGKYHRLFEASTRTMIGQRVAGSRTWRGRDYRFFVPWVLDQSNTMKGMLFFSPYAKDSYDIFSATQKSDGMVFSNFSNDGGIGHYDTAYGHLGYVLHDGGLQFVRQPTENHVEYEYVNILYQAWKASGDDRWMANGLASAIRALEYSVTDPSRYSKRFELLKRPLTIDSWDFQVEDAYLVRDTSSPTMTINPEKTKFGVFFGDNTGYVQACYRLSEMLARSGRKADADAWKKRGDVMLGRLTKLAWNGRFFRHFIDEDPTVKRDLGVEMDSQIAQGNAYSLNRGLPQAQAAAIIRTYMELSQHLPAGSPGEWYAIYPPFKKGFGDHNSLWQYMNGGVAGHAAGELARGALAHGFEAYGASVLDRSLALAERTDGKIHFAYTGAIEPAPGPAATTVIDLHKFANMDLRAETGKGSRPWMEGEKGNDMAGLPPGELKVKDIPFQILDPTRNQGRALIAVSRRTGWKSEVAIPVARKAAAVHVIHVSHVGQAKGEDTAGAIVFRYDDGSSQGVYMKRDVHVSGWWYPALGVRKRNGPWEAPQTNAYPDAAVAWRGANGKSKDVGVSWVAIANPQPEKKIKSLVIEAPATGAVYGVLALTLADRMPYHEPNPISFGGPDNWAAANMMAALVEGLGGVADTDRAYGTVTLSPRFAASGTQAVKVTARYPASSGYASYDFRHEPSRQTIRMTLTGSARTFHGRILLPEGTDVSRIAVDGKESPPKTELVESSRYAIFDAPAGLHEVTVGYRKLLASGLQP